MVTLLCTAQALKAPCEMAQQPVSIIGAGIGGLALGRCLLKCGIPVVLYDKAPSSSRHSYGITLHPSTYMPLLNILGMDERTFKHHVAVDGAMGGIGRLKPKSLILSDQYDKGSFRAHRGNLELLLREGLDIQWEEGLENMDVSANGKLQLHIKSGQSLDRSFAVGADGPHSITRKSLSPGSEPMVLPIVAFNGKRRVKKDHFDAVYGPAMDDCNVVEVKINDTVLQVAIIEKKADQVGISWIYSRPSQGATDPLYKPNRPASGATNIPEEFFQEIGALQNLEQPFKEVFYAETLKKERILTWLMRVALVSLAELQELQGKGVVFIGDAVHTEPILGGNGANNTIDDAISLAGCIANGESISLWYEKRYPIWVEATEKSKRLIKEMHWQRKHNL